MMNFFDRIYKRNRKLRCAGDFPYTQDARTHPIEKFTTSYKKLVSNSTKVPIILICMAKEEIADSKCVDLIRDITSEKYLKDMRARSQFYREIPLNTIAVSFASSNFYVGNTCHEFYVKDEFRNKDPFSKYIHRFLSENVQATYYVERNEEYLAGLTYYLVEKGEPKLRVNDEALINFETESKNVYPNQNRWETLGWQERKQYSRFCENVGQRVIVVFKDNSITHKSFCYSTMKIHEKRCKHCRKDFLNYKYVEVDPPLRVKVHHSATGILVNATLWPKLTDINEFLETHPDFNVHLDSTVDVWATLKEEFKDRIGLAATVGKLIDLKEPVEQLDSPMELINSKLMELGISDLNLTIDTTAASAFSDLLSPLGLYPESSSSQSPEVLDFFPFSDDQFEIVTDC